MSRWIRKIDAIPAWNADRGVERKDYNITGFYNHVHYTITDDLKTHIQTQHNVSVNLEAPVMKGKEATPGRTDLTVSTNNKDIHTDASIINPMAKRHSELIDMSKFPSQIFNWETVDKIVEIVNQDYEIHKTERFKKNDYDPAMPREQQEKGIKASFYPIIMTHNGILGEQIDLFVKDVNDCLIKQQAQPLSTLHLKSQLVKSMYKALWAVRAYGKSRVRRPELMSASKPLRIVKRRH